MSLADVISATPASVPVETLAEHAMTCGGCQRCDFVDTSRLHHAICGACVEDREPEIGDVFLCGLPVPEPDPMPDDDPPLEDRCIVCSEVIFCPVCKHKLEL